MWSVRFHDIGFKVAQNALQDVSDGSLSQVFLCLKR